MNRVFTAAAVAASILLVTACDNAEQRQEKYLSQGGEYLEQGNLDKARISFKNALQIDPANIPAKLKFAEVMERQGEYKDAYGHYMAVLEKDANNLVALERQGKILMLAGETVKARENAEKLLALKGENYVPALVLKAGTLSAEKNVVDAMKLALHAVELEPNHLEGTVLLAALHMRQTDFSGAEALLRRAIAAHPAERGFKGMLVDALAKQGKKADVELVLRSLAEEEPDKLIHAMQLAKHLHQSGKSDDALTVMESYVAAHSDDTSAKLSLVQLIDVAKNVEEGERKLDGYIEQDASIYALQFARIDRLLAQKKKAEAITALEAISSKEKTGNDALQARLILAQIKVADKDLAGAKKLLEEIIALNPADLGALALRGGIAIQERRFVDAIADLRNVTKERADDVKSVLLLATAHLNNNEADLAVELLHKTVKLHPRNSRVRMLLAELLTRKNDHDGAVAQYRAILEQKPDDAQALTAIAKLYQTTNKLSELASIADSMLEQKDSMAVGFYYQGWLKVQDSKLDEARELFEKALSIAPASIEPATAMVQTWLSQNQWQAAVKRLDAMLATQPTNATLYNLKAEAQIVGKDLAGAETSLKKATEINPKWWIPYRTLAALRSAKKDFPGAQQYLESGLAATNEIPMLRMELALLHERNGKIDESIAVYKKMIDDGMTGDSVINNLAMLLTTKTDASSLDAARSYSEKLATSDNPIYLDTAGWVHYKRGDYQAALPILKRAVELAPKHPQIRYHLGVAYFRNNQLQEAKDNLSLALKDERKFEGRDDAKQVLQQIQKS